MPTPLDPSALAEVSTALGGLSDRVTAAEADLLSCLVVMGEPDAQQAVDGWIDQVVDLLRAVDEVTAQHLTTLSRVSRRHDQPVAAHAPAATASLPSDPR
ncbi:hypothetical protein N802_18305 [Knoellia sinensis KCTC 19936]|uniref:Uncharacterized protein n=1 Tax=Knoellia sinensis KCTC 19936 TaxID=1385520 RepID=A0A0A0J8D5_9MICO|nr:hypothetical protein [Knoellia sinensis]KGN32317.1 hypothetical protein N802_18305 [Knoellia sinensis KCTC 19936]